MPFRFATLLDQPPAQATGCNFAFHRCVIVVLSLAPRISKEELRNVTCLGCSAKNEDNPMTRFSLCSVNHKTAWWWHPSILGTVKTDWVYPEGKLRKHPRACVCIICVSMCRKTRPNYACGMSSLIYGLYIMHTLFITNIYIYMIILI